jgi:hypothetical protein
MKPSFLWIVIKDWSLNLNTTSVLVFFFFSFLLSSIDLGTVRRIIFQHLSSSRQLNNIFFHPTLSYFTINVSLLRIFIKNTGLTGFPTKKSGPDPIEHRRLPTKTAITNKDGDYQQRRRLPTKTAITNKDGDYQQRRR